MSTAILSYAPAGKTEDIGASTFSDRRRQRLVKKTFFDHILRVLKSWVPFSDTILPCMRPSQLPFLWNPPEKI